jgi:hypothetical protein
MSVIHIKSNTSLLILRSEMYQISEQDDPEAWLSRERVNA